MATLHLYDKLLDYLVEKATPEEILAFQLSESEQDYARELVERNNAGTLTPEETIQVQQLLQFERMASVLKAKALRALKQS
jgi:hypothetical protein